MPHEVEGVAVFALQDAAERVNQAGLWWLATILVIGPALVFVAMVVLIWVLGELRDYFDLLRDDRTEGSYFWEASIVLACLVILIAAASYFLFLLRQAGS